MFSSRTLCVSETLEFQRHRVSMSVSLYPFIGISFITFQYECAVSCFKLTLLWRRVFGWSRHLFRHNAPEHPQPVTLHFIPDSYSLFSRSPLPLPVSPSLRRRRRGCCHGNNRSRGCSGPFRGKPSLTLQGTDRRGGKRTDTRWLSFPGFHCLWWEHY